MLIKGMIDKELFVMGPKISARATVKLKVVDGRHLPLGLTNDHCSAKRREAKRDISRDVQSFPCVFLNLFFSHRLQNILSTCEASISNGLFLHESSGLADGSRKSCNPHNEIS